MLVLYAAFMQILMVGRYGVMAYEQQTMVRSCIQSDATFLGETMTKAISITFLH